MNIYKVHSIKNRDTFLQKRVAILCAVILTSLLFATTSAAQTEPEVKAKLDTTKITIGEEILYTIEVEADQTKPVVFPEGQTFNPLEVIESYKVDTSFTERRMKLIKEYGLTQFDSGKYRIPRQRIVIGAQTIETDSFTVEVKNVVLDTVNQGLYDIKPIIDVPKNYGKLLWKYLSWILPVLLAIALFLYFLLRRYKKKKEADLYVAPFDQALATLQQLDDSNLIQEAKYKEYYTTLTDTVRRYYEEKVYDRALESTTEELIDRLQAERDSGHIKFSSETIKQLKEIFQRADLVKFARITPQEGKPLADRIAIEQIVKQTKEVLPAPTEEELMKDAMYREALSRKRTRKLWITGIAGVIGILILATGIGIAVKGYNEVKDFVLGNQTRELAEGKWVTSEYGFPQVILSSPKVLKRESIELPKEAQGKVESTFFTWSNESARGFITATITQVRHDPNIKTEIEDMIERALEGMEEEGFSVPFPKNDKFTTPNGAEGVKTYGTGIYSIPGTSIKGDAEFAIVSFQSKGVIQQVMLLWDSSDEYATQIANRMLASLELQKGEE